VLETREFWIQKAFLTESERSGERLLEAARRVSGSESITELKGREQDGLWILDDEFWIVGGLVLKDCKYAL
jgi:hypothetical protein